VGVDDSDTDKESRERESDGGSDGNAAYKLRLFEIPTDNGPDFTELENFDSDDLWSSKVSLSLELLVYGA
jgi:hypothetical protein